MEPALLLTTSKFVLALSRNGIPVAKSTARMWGRKYPGLTVRVAGRTFWREEIIPSLLAGVPLVEIAATARAGHVNA